MESAEVLYENIWELESFKKVLFTSLTVKEIVFNHTDNNNLN